jgi:uncharacterized repeat protein (TIGR02543 family)
VRTGYTFGGWWTKVNGEGAQYTSKTSVVPSSLTLYAKWTANLYNITVGAVNITPPSYDSATRSYTGGTAVISGNSPFTYGTQVTLTATPLPGYYFLGWAPYPGYYGNVVSSDAVYSFTATEDKNLVARFYKLLTPVLSTSSWYFDVTSIIVRFDQVPGATRYDVFRSESQNGEYKPIATMPKRDFTSRGYQDKDVKLGIPYYYKVQAVCEGETAMTVSELQKFPAYFTAGPPPPYIKGLGRIEYIPWLWRIETRSYPEIEVKANCNIKYILYRKISTGNWEYFRNVTPNAYVIVGLYKTYYYKMHIVYSQDGRQYDTGFGNTIACSVFKSSAATDAFNDLLNSEVEK